MSMSREPLGPEHPDRREFLKTAGAVAASAVVVPRLDAIASAPFFAASAEAARAGWPGC